MARHCTASIGARGFTLIEIMVALAVFALMSGIGYRGLEAVLNARARVDQETVKWRELSLAFVAIDQSLSSAVDRSIRDRDGLIAPAFSGLASVRSDEEPPLAFSRMGFPDHGGVLAGLQRVGYRVRLARLEQLVWPVLDQAPGSEPHAMELAQSVVAMKLRYLRRNGEWHAGWPVPGDPAPMPAAVEVSLSLATGEAVTRLFVLP